MTDHTYISKIETLDNAQQIYFTSNSLIKKKYWSIGELFCKEDYNLEDSFHVIDFSLYKSIIQLFQNNDNIINFSLTGGWDSRVILSYLLPNYKNRIKLYSFGAINSSDIKIPEIISDKEDLNYQPYILNKKYLSNEFIKTARQTIVLSSGTRNYKRSHYLYSVKKLHEISNYLLTGIFGDEIFKFGKPQGGAVLSSNTISLIDNNFSFDYFKNRILENEVSKLSWFHGINFIEKFRERIRILHKKFNNYENKSHKHFAFRFGINLRKYFGNEANSYNDFVFCYSPFIEYNFIKNYSRTKYAGFRFNFNSNNFKLKKFSSDLYTKLVITRYPKLACYPTSRGYSMKDTKRLAGILKILYEKYLKNTNRDLDAFNTNETYSIFTDMLNNIKSNKFDISEITKLNNSKDDALSLMYWIWHVENNYL